jgi:hypothetical protein
MGAAISTGSECTVVRGVARYRRVQCDRRQRPVVLIPPMVVKPKPTNHRNLKRRVMSGKVAEDRRRSLTFKAEMEGWPSESADSVCLLVHPVRPLLACGSLGVGPSARGVVALSTTAFDRHYGRRWICAGSYVVVPSGAAARLSESRLDFSLRTGFAAKC